MFQKFIIDKYIELNIDKIHSAYKRYTNFFHNTEQLTFLRRCKKTEFKEYLLHNFFGNILNYKLEPEQKYDNNHNSIIIINNDIHTVIELKNIQTINLKQPEIKTFSDKYQHKNISYVIISNFEKLHFYIDNPIKHFEWNLFKLAEEQFASLWLCLAYENISTDLPKQLKAESAAHQDKITKIFYNSYKEFQNTLFADLIVNNSGLEKLTLFLCSQKILNRLVFILFSEDCGLLPSELFKKIIREWKNLDDADEYRPLYTYFQKYFAYIDDGGKGKNQNIFGYNGGLFKPDDFLDNLKISDSTFTDHLAKLISYNYRNDITVEIIEHVFENFLSEIERLKYQLNGVKNCNWQVVEKHKKDGIFYTPRFITSYIIESTVGKLCEAKRAELGLSKDELLGQIETDFRSKGKKQKTTITDAVLNKLEEYRRWLLSISVCDPACGSGGFLIAALEFLKNEHHYIDQITAQIFGHSIVFSECELSILENNLFGVDINAESVEITKLALWLRTAKPNRKLNFLDKNIKCGNALIADPKIDPAKKFDWKKEFPNIFKKGGFNVVIGNPPHLFARIGKFSEAEKSYYYSRYPLVNYQLNTYLLFIDLSYRHLLRENGVLGFVIPNNCLTINSFQPFRKFLLEKVGDVGVVNITGNIFKDANVDRCIISFAKKNADKISLGEINNEKLSIIGTLPAKNFACGQYVVNISTSQKPEAIKLTQKIELETKTLEQNANLETGIKAYQPDKRKSSQPTQDKENRIYHSREQKNAGFIKFLDGKDVGRYLLTWSGEYIQYGDWLAEPRRNVDFTATRILVRQIPSQPPYCINAVLTNDHAINDINSMVIFNFKIEPLYLLTILNSRLMSFWFVNKFDKFQKEIFPQFKINELASVPIKTCSLSMQKKFVAVANKMIVLHNELQNKRKDFLRELSDVFKNIRLAGVLENFDKLEFKDFLVALLKSNIKLQADQRIKWEEIFKKNRLKCRNISNQITETDNKINQLVYKLYDLNEDEIEIVERLK
ncbi:MAG: N-6 DNA methylase [Planctomycetaceae bacterium]|jgi:type I restriction-modification system DNA methylase subunit|nr:N-6 DNA methylase [Planctomycetaceae bacterium]